MNAEVKRRARRDPYDPDVSRVVSIRVQAGVLKQLRLLATERDLTVCGMLRIEAERIASAGIAL